MQYSKKKSPELVEQTSSKPKQTQAQPTQTTYSTTAKSFKDLKKDILETPILAKKEEPVVTPTPPQNVEEQIPNQPLTTEIMVAAWNQCLQTIKPNAQLSAVASALQPSLLDSDIVFTVHSTPEKSAFDQQIRAIYTQQIKQLCGPISVTIRVDIVEETYTTKPSNSAEKYEYFVKQNPYLETMKDAFNLEIE